MYEIDYTSKKLNMCAGSTLLVGELFDIERQYVGNPVLHILRSFLALQLFTLLFPAISTFIYQSFL